MAVDIFELVITPLKAMLGYLINPIWYDELGISIIGAISFLLIFGLIVKLVLASSIRLREGEETNKVKVGKPISDADYINKAIDEDWY